MSQRPHQPTNLLDKNGSNSNIIIFGSPSPDDPSNNSTIVNLSSNLNTNHNSNSNTRTSLPETRTSPLLASPADVAQVSRFSQVLQTSPLARPNEIRQTVNCHDSSSACHKITTINLNEPWNIMVRRYLKRIGEQSQGYSWAHEQERLYYERLQRYLSIIGGVLMAIITTFNTSNVLTLVNNQTYYILNLIIGIILLVLGVFEAIVIAITNLGNFEQRIFDHKWNAIKFNEIYNDILAQFSLPVEKRERDEDYLRNKTKEFLDNRATAPAVRLKTFKKYANVTKNENIFRPITVGNFDKIEIIVDDDTKGGPTP